MTNGMIFKYEFDHPSSYDCIYEWDASAGKIRKDHSSAVGSIFYDKAGTMDME